MRSLDDQEDWLEWQVSARDLIVRRVLVQPFVPGVGEFNQSA